jgi:hypothetical protein
MASKNAPFPKIIESKRVAAAQSNWLKTMAIEGRGLLRLVFRLALFADC